MRQPFMHREILTTAQTALLPVIARFKKDFGLVGGTAIALHIGHRESIDFDLFNPDEFRNARIRQTFVRAGRRIFRVFRDEIGQFTFQIDGVQVTFFHYPFPVPYTESFDDIIRMPTLLSLAAMKAFAFGRRSKWKDYVDMYFILRSFHTLDEITAEAEKLFEGEFNAKLFREQLGYFDDINYGEQVVYLPGFEVPDEDIKRALEEYSTR